MIMRRRIGLFLLVLFILALQLLSISNIDFSLAYPYEDLPTMDVWFDGGGSNTYVYFFNLKYELNYEVSLLDDLSNIKSGPHELSVLNASYFVFDVQIESNDRIVLDYKINEIDRERLVDYQVSDIGVDVVNVKTDVITGYALTDDPIEVTVFVGDENPVAYKRMCTPLEDHWTADFSVPGIPLGNRMVEYRHRPGHAA